MLYTVCFCEHQSGLFVFISRFRRRRTCPKANEAESATRNRCRVAHIFIYFLLYFFALAARTRSHLAAALVGAALARIDRRGRVCALSLSLCTFSSLSLSPCPSSVHHHRDQNTERCLALVCVCVCVWGFRSMAFHRSPAGSVDFAWRKKRIRLLSRSSAPSSTSRSTGRIAHRTSMASPGNNTPSIRSPLEREMTTTTRTVNQVDTGKTTSWSGLLAVGQLT